MTQQIDGEMSPADYARAMDEAISQHEQVLASALRELHSQAGVLGEIAALLVRALRRGNTVLLAGNGGSAAEAQHFAAELVGRYKRERAPYAAIALTTDTSILTAIGNDYSYDEVFSRQVGGLGREGDVLVALSTSGESANLLRAVEVARERRMSVVAVTGGRPNSLAGVADLAFQAPGPDTATVQEFHLMFTHLVCDAVEAELAGESART